MKSEDEIDCRYTQNITCPYCGWEDRDSWEFGQDTDDVQCGECEETFVCEPDIAVTYCTYKKVKKL